MHLVPGANRQAVNKLPTEQGVSAEALEKTGSGYDAHIRPIKQVSDKWWQSTVKKFNGALPASMCKYWGELMGMAGGHVRPPLADLSDEEKSELKQDLEAVQNGT